MKQNLLRILYHFPYSLYVNGQAFRNIVPNTTLAMHYK